MSRFSYDNELIEQIGKIDEKCVEIIKYMKNLEKRIKRLENIAKEKGIKIEHIKIKNNNEDTCMIS